MVAPLCAHSSFEYKVLGISLAGEHTPDGFFKVPAKAQELKRLGPGFKPLLRSKGFFLGSGHAGRPCPGFKCHLPFQEEPQGRSLASLWAQDRQEVPAFYWELGLCEDHLLGAGSLPEPKCTGGMRRLVQPLK